MRAPRTADPACRCSRELLLSNDTFQQLHVIDHRVYGVFSDLVRDIDSAMKGRVLFHMTSTCWCPAVIRRCARRMRRAACLKAAIASTM